MDFPNVHNLFIHAFVVCGEFVRNRSRCKRHLSRLESLKAGFLYYGPGVFGLPPVSPVHMNRIDTHSSSLCYITHSLLRFRDNQTGNNSSHYVLHCVPYSRYDSLTVSAIHCIHRTKLSCNSLDSLFENYNCRLINPNNHLFKFGCIILLYNKDLFLILLIISSYPLLLQL